GFHSSNGPPWPTRFTVRAPRFLAAGGMTGPRKFSATWPFSPDQTTASLWGARVTGANPLLVTFEGQLNQAVQKLRILQTARFPQLGIHADRGKAGDGIDLVHKEASRLAVKE